MKLKTLIVTVVVLAVASALVFYLQRPAPSVSVDPHVGQPLVTDAMLKDTAKLTLSDQGKTVTLTRTADGTWRVSSYYDLPADFSKLSRFIDDLAAAKIQRAVTRNPERIARLEFKDTKIQLFDSAGKALWSVTLGKNAATGGRFLRLDDEATAYLATLNAWIDPESRNWADAQLLHLKPEEIAKVEVGFAGDEPPLIASREKKAAPWVAAKTPGGQQLNPAKITDLLNALDALRFTDTSAPDDAAVAAARAHERTIKLSTFSGQTLTVALGREPEQKKLKPPAAGAKSGPAALGSSADLPKVEKPGASALPAKPPLPEFETIPAGPVYAFIRSSDTSAVINALMAKRAFQISEYIFTSLPQKRADLFEPVPSGSNPASPPETTPTSDPKK